MESDQKNIIVLHDSNIKKTEVNNIAEQLGLAETINIFSTDEIETTKTGELIPLYQPCAPEKEFTRSKILSSHPKKEIDAIKALDEIIQLETAEERKKALDKFKQTLKETQCLAMLNNRSINALIATTTKKKDNLNYNTNTGRLSIQTDVCGIILEDFLNVKGLRVSAHKLVHMALIKFTSQNNQKTKNINYIAEIPIEDYMKMCGKKLDKPNRDKAIRTVKEDLTTLSKISLKYEDTKGNMINPHIIGSNAVKSGKIIVAIDPLFGASLLKSNLIMQLSPQVFQLSNQNPTAYQIAYKLHLHQSNHNNIKQGTANIISVKSLLKSCDNIPGFEEVRHSKTYRHINKRIIDPFEKVLNTLQEEKIIKWNYCKIKKQPLTDEEIATIDGNLFEKLYIEFKCHDLFPQKNETTISEKE